MSTMRLKEWFAYWTSVLGRTTFVYELWLKLTRNLFLRKKKNKRVHLNGIACAFPSTRYNQLQMRERFLENYCGGKGNVLPQDLDFIHRVFSATLIETCYVNLPEDQLFRRMKREEYTNYVKRTILSMACEAARNALADTDDFQLHQITHLIFGTMTGTISAPSMDILICKELALCSNVKRLNVESMGCLTGFRLVGLARDIALESDENLVLVIVCDIRSALGNQLTSFIPGKAIDKSNVIVSALFRDACGAALFSQRSSKKSAHVIDHRSAIIDNTFELGRLKEFDDSSIHLYLDKQLPYAVFSYLPNLVNQLLEEYQIRIENCQFAVHTGGPKIIRGIQKCLNLEDEQLCASWYVMINYGNLSGSSNLVVLEHFRRWKYSAIKPVHKQIVFPKDFNRYRYVIGLSFGPGIGVECVLLQLE